MADRVVLFSKTRDRLANPIDFQFSGAGDFKILVADLQAGTWTIECESRVVGTAGASVEEGAVVFKGPAGHYRLQVK